MKTRYYIRKLDNFKIIKINGVVSVIKCKKYPDL